MGQALAGGFLGDGPLVKGGALHEVVEGLVGRRLGGEQEVAACRRDGHGNRLAGEKVIAEVDRPQALQALAVGGQPALGGIALAVLFLGPVLGAMNSGIKGSAMAWPGATAVAASMAW